MAMEIAHLLSHFCVEFILEAFEVVLQIMHCGTLLYVVDIQSGLKDGTLVDFLLGRIDTLLNQINDLRNLHLRNLSTFFVEHIGCSSLSLLSIDAHIQMECLISKHGQEITFASAQTSKAFSAFVQDNVTESVLDFPDELLIGNGELDGITRIVCKLKHIFVLLKVLLSPESFRDASISLLLKASVITLKRRPIADRLAHNLDMSASASTVVSKLSSAKHFRALFTWMTRFLAFVNASVSLLFAAISAASCHQKFFTLNAISRFMTDLLALMTTLKFNAALFAAVVGLLRTREVGHHFFGTVAHFHDKLRTGRTVSCMAALLALVPTVQFFRALLFALRSRLTTFNGRIDL